MNQRPLPSNYNDTWKANICHKVRRRHNIPEAPINIFGGTRLLRRRIDEFGSLKLALIAYNAGPNRVRKGKRIPSETKKYVKRVIHYYRIYKKGE